MESAASIIQRTWRNYVICQYRKLKEKIQEMKEELYQHEEYGGLLNEVGGMFGCDDY